MGKPVKKEAAKKGKSGKAASTKAPKMGKKC